MTDQEAEDLAVIQAEIDALSSAQRKKALRKIKRSADRAGSVSLRDALIVAMLMHNWSALKAREFIIDGLSSGRVSGTGVNSATGLRQAIPTWVRGRVH
jgi:hypothetical protein